MKSTSGVLPPLGPTGVEPEIVSLGWFAGTAAPDDPPATGWGIVRGLVGPSTLSPGNRHYSAGVRADDWSWQVLWAGRGGAAGTVYVEVRQGVWEALPPDGAADLAGRLLTAVRCSRLDLAGDVLLPCALPSDLFAARDRARTRTHRGGWELMVRGDGGQKLTVGSRTSERYLRVYVKDVRVRHELELKGATGRAACAAILSGDSLRAVWGAEYSRLVEWAH